MELFLLAFIVIVQNTAVFLDNHGIFYLTSRHTSTKIATIYTKKFQIDFLSRGFLFFTPPLLGLMLTNNNLYFLLLCLLSSSAVTLVLTIFQSFNFLTKMKMTFSFPLTLKNVILLLMGLIVYAIYLYVPFYLNILSYFFKENSLWIVQLSPALTAVSSVFVVYYMDPKVAKFIDAIKIKKNSAVLFELIAIRLLGRLMILMASIFIFMKLV
jgi:hypothetical protein